MLNSPSLLEILQSKTRVTLVNKYCTKLSSKLKNVKITYFFSCYLGITIKKKAKKWRIQI